jgi:hypothetical protein
MYRERKGKAMQNRHFRLAALGAIGLFAACVTHNPAMANIPNMQLDGDQFSTACTRSDEAWVSFCNGYVQAVVDSLRDSDGVCLSPSVTRAEIITSVEAQITGSKKLRAMNAYDAFKMALRRSYPCA